MADIFQGNFQKRDEEIKKLLRIEDSFDLIRRRFVIGGRQAAFYTVDGFLKGEVSEKVMEFFYKITPEQMPEDFAGFLQQEIPYLDLMKIADQEAFESEFAKWFAHMKDQLTEDAAGNLQLQIDKQQEQIDAILREDVRKEGFVGHCYNGFTHCQPT